MPLLIGADPEFFLKKGQQYFSAHGIIPGTKRRPYKVEDGAVQVDGLALEANIIPAKTKEEFVYRLSSVIRTMRGMIPDEYEFAFDAVAAFDVDHMISQPEEALELGCDPDYNAYTGEVNPSPFRHPTKRAAGGHIHLGWTKGKLPFDEEHFNHCARVVQQMDFFVGLPSVILDKDTERKQMYGKAGAFRPKRYGAEYRVSSNWWLRDPEYMQLMYENVNVGWNILEDGRFLPDEYGRKAEEIINSNDVVSALEICEEIGIPVGMQ